MKTLALAAIGLASVGFATSAQAAVSLVPGTNQLDAMVHLDPGFDADDVNVVHGLAKPTEAAVTFTAPTLIDGTGGNGYAQISDADMPGGTADFAQLVIDLTDATLAFNAYEFSVQASDTGQLRVEYIVFGDATQTYIQAGIVDIGKGNKDYYLSGENFDKVRLTSITAGVFIDQIKQNDINVLSNPSPVPEPATWAMFIFGFAAVGYTLRRRRPYRIAQAV